MQNLKIGDVVKLKSGGPKMTIFRASDDDVECVWFLWFQFGIGEEGPYYGNFTKSGLILCELEDDDNDIKFNG